MQSYYAWYGSPLHLIIEDEIAEACNRFAQAFMDAQRDHKERTGTQWDPSEPLMIVTNNRDQKAYDDMARVINLMVEVNGGGLTIAEEDMPSDTPWVKL